GFECRVGENGGERLQQALVLPWSSSGALSCHVVREQPSRQRLDRLPAIEWVAVVRGEEPQFVGRDIGDELDRRRKFAVERGYRRLGDVGEDKGLRGLGQREHAALKSAAIR